LLVHEAGKTVATATSVKIHLRIRILPTSRPAHPEPSEGNTGRQGATIIHFFSSLASRFFPSLATGR
jgi:hypothetical protein